MTNSALLKEILNLMEENHINLYHDVSKAEIENYILSLENFDSLNSIDFDREMLKIFAKFKDAHTTYDVPHIFLSHQMFFIDNKIFVKDGAEYKEVFKIGNILAEDFVSQIIELLPFETNAYYVDSIKKCINNQYYYQMLGLCNKDGNIDIITHNNNKEESLTLSKISREEFFNLNFAKPERNYSMQIIKDNILKIKYRRCIEYEEYPFNKFVEEVKEKIISDKITNYILDLRGNHGGDSSIIKPLIEAIKEAKLNGVVLIDNGVFSSGRWAVTDFKKNFNSILIGEPTGGATASYGYCKNLKVQEKTFSVSTRFWDFRSIFGYDGSINPDIYVSNTIDDFRNETDSQLQKAIEVVNKIKNNEIEHEIE